MVKLLWLSFLGSSLAAVISVVTETEFSTVYACAPTAISPAGPQPSSSWNGGGAESGNGPATQDFTGLPSLEPTIYVDIDLTDVNNLVPSDSSELYYTPGGAVGEPSSPSFTIVIGG